MKRDPDYIRQLLLDFEAAEGWRIRHSTHQSMSKDDEKRDYHIHLMVDQGLLVPVGRNMVRLHSSAHDALDAVRDQNVWESAKSIAAKAGGFTFDLLVAIAVDYIKTKAKQHIG